jgi:hypothetical protein
MLEMQEAGDKENWNEAEHMENRRKLALKRKYMMMGLATVGGSLVIGLSAGLLAPVIEPALQQASRLSVWRVLVDFLLAPAVRP